MGRWLVLGVTLWLSGCALWPSAPQGDMELGQGQSRTWILRGRVAVHRPEGNDSGKMEWRLQGDSQNLELLSPLGTTVALVTSTPLESHLTLADRREFSAADPESLTTSVLGYAWPLAGLPWWLRGLPDPGGVAEVERDEQQHPTRVAQSGWLIRYADWRLIGQDWLPGQITLEREGVSIRIRADQWVLEQHE